MKCSRITVQEWDIDLYSWETRRTLEHAEIKTINDGVLRLSVANGEHDDGSERRKFWEMDHPEFVLFGFLNVNGFVQEMDDEYFPLSGWKKERWILEMER